MPEFGIPASLIAALAFNDSKGAIGTVAKGAGEYSDSKIICAYCRKIGLGRKLKLRCGFHRGMTFRKNGIGRLFKLPKTSPRGN